jgi:hypothetical protein
LINKKYKNVSDQNEIKEINYLRTYKSNLELNKHNPLTMEIIQHALEQFKKNPTEDARINMIFSLLSYKATLKLKKKLLLLLLFFQTKRFNLVLYVDVLQKLYDQVTFQQSKYSKFIQKISDHFILENKVTKYVPFRREIEIKYFLELINVIHDLKVLDLHVEPNFPNKTVWAFFNFNPDRDYGSFE